MTKAVESVAFDTLGREETADVVVAADGIRSSIRRRALRGNPLRRTPGSKRS